MMNHFRFSLFICYVQYILYIVICKNPISFVNLRTLIMNFRSFNFKHFWISFHFFKHLCACSVLFTYKTVRQKSTVCYIHQPNKKILNLPVFFCFWVYHVINRFLSQLASWKNWKKLPKIYSFEFWQENWESFPSSTKIVKSF